MTVGCWALFYSNNRQQQPHAVRCTASPFRRPGPGRGTMMVQLLCPTPQRMPTKTRVSTRLSQRLATGQWQPCPRGPLRRTPRSHHMHLVRLLSRAEPHQSGCPSLFACGKAKRREGKSLTGRSSWLWRWHLASSIKLFLLEGGRCAGLESSHRTRCT